jgi:outer membrane protein OmpA-like peptidoglycan-associated protein
MFFVSDMSGGFGGSDIYFVEKDEKNNWSEPVNLGAKINTKGDELFPVLYSDSLLYYSSNGKTGYGGLDIFSVAFDQASFSDAEILSAPVNSGADDFGILVNPLNTEEGFLVSNRFGGRGDDDIYKFQPLVKEDYSAQSNFDVITNPAIGCFLDSSKLALASDTIGIAELVDTFKIIDSILEIELAEPVAVIEIGDTVIEETESEPTEQKPEIDDVSMDEAIYFNFDQSAITERSQLVVDKWLIAMKEDPSVEIMIKSYTDCRGSNEYNISLSWRRTKAIKEYLISSGIEHTRIASKSMGATNFINNCDRPNACLDKEHGLNRRSEIELINQ